MRKSNVHDLKRSIIAEKTSGIISLLQQDLQGLEGLRGHWASINPAKSAAQPSPALLARLAKYIKAGGTVETGNAGGAGKAFAGMRQDKAGKAGVKGRAGRKPEAVRGSESNRIATHHQTLSLASLQSVQTVRSQCPPALLTPAGQSLHWPACRRFQSRLSPATPCAMPAGDGDLWDRYNACRGIRRSTPTKQRCRLQTCPCPVSLLPLAHNCRP
mmetsp:Transcript_36553/g.113967  ORF Transcript_36553/g.113967 Transcript_36553/m.113967 type:complete len:215 (-) Transcript_36553:1342-1986(-)